MYRELDIDTIIKKYSDFKFTQLFYNYYAGKPRETKDITVSNEQPIFNIDLDEV